jgi:hypothetical protein
VVPKIEKRKSVPKVENKFKEFCDALNKLKPSESFLWRNNVNIRETTAISALQHFTGRKFASRSEIDGRRIFRLS